MAANTPTPETQNPRYVSVQEAEQITGIKADTLLRWASKKMHGIPLPVRVGPKIVRWNLDELLAWLDAHREKEAS